MKMKKQIVMVIGMALFLGMVLTACGKREAEAVYQNAFFSMEFPSGVTIEEGENQNWKVLYQGALSQRFRWERNFPMERIYRPLCRTGLGKAHR